MLFGLGFSLLFPQIEVASYDWQVKAKSPTVVHPSIVLITLDEQDPASCGNERWNSSVIASAISALHKAGASIIAPAVRFQFPNPPECGDVFGNAQLLEATKQAGNVVYPSFVEPLIANEAQATGWFMLAPDEDGIFRGISSRQMAHDMKHLPLGLTIASAYNNSSPLNLPDQGLVSFVGRWSDQPFPTYTFTELFDFVQGRQDIKLSTLARDKIVLIFPVTSNSEMLSTPLESAVPLGFLHANILNSSLTHSWIKKPSWESTLFRTFGVIFIIALISSWRRDIWGWLVVGIMILGHFSINAMLFFATDTVWSYLNSTIAIVSTLLGTTVWPIYEKRKKDREQIRNVSRQLTVMQEDLARKELHVEQLEDELLDAKEYAQNTSEKYASLSVSEDETRQQLQEAEKETEGARQQLEDLQHELFQLRKVSPALPIDKPQSSESHQQKIQSEAKDFGILTCSPVLLKTFQELKKAANTDNPILIFGETGTGKELFAQAAHQLSHRSHAPFVSVNMAAIRPELFESELFGHVKGAFTGAISRRGFLETADHGSVFLDEIGELPLDLQAKLLRVLENGEFYRVGQSSPTHVDVRIIAATNRDLSQAVNDGHYREDLYYRLRSLVINLPPLQDRGEEDLTLLVQRIVEDLSRHTEQGPVQLTQSAMHAIHAYAWPGNVRELRQTLAQAVALANGPLLSEDDLRLPQGDRAETIETTHSGDESRPSREGKDEMARREDVFILSTLRQHGFDMQATAKTLAWDRSTVTQRLKGLGFQALVAHNRDVHRAAASIAGTPDLERIAELKLKEYYRNLLASTTPYKTAEEALANCRKRLRNIPERHFPAIEVLIRQHYENANP
ncbi:MAG: hypothetical protein NPIRA05_14970 [Nitrospirales bacterium]|nr:MAG: hypothetical protein NPIRA05_14970 [Nitrospirales bacterium]